MVSVTRGKLFVLAFGLVMVLAFAVNLSPVFAQKPIKVGLIDAFSGGAAAITKPSLVGWQMVIDEFNLNFAFA